MSDPISPSARVSKPLTFTVGLGMPELAHADVSYTFADRYTASAGVVANLGGTALRAAGVWHPLASSNHSLFVGPALTVYPGGPVFGGNRVVLVPQAIAGWEWRSDIGFTTRLSFGGGAEITPVYGTVTPALSGRFELGWSF
jgi:hypothetical protein